MSNATQNEEAFFEPSASEKLDNGNLFPYWYVSNLHRSDLTTDVDSSGATIRINHGCYCEASLNYWLRVYLGTTREDGSNPTWAKDNELWGSQGNVGERFSGQEGGWQGFGDDLHLAGPDGDWGHANIRMAWGETLEGWTHIYSDWPGGESKAEGTFRMPNWNPIKKPTITVDESSLTVTVKHNGFSVRDAYSTNPDNSGTLKLQYSRNNSAWFDINPSGNESSIISVNGTKTFQIPTAAFQVDSNGKRIAQTLYFRAKITSRWYDLLDVSSSWGKKMVAFSKERGFIAHDTSTATKKNCIVYVKSGNTYKQVIEGYSLENSVHKPLGA